MAANNGRIANEGECDFKFRTVEGDEQNLTFQIAEVNKTLAAVSALVDAGHRVVFDQDEATGVDISFITHKKIGASVRMRRERNVWVVDAYIDEADDDMDVGTVEQIPTKPVFIRPE